MVKSGCKHRASILISSLIATGVLSMMGTQSAHALVHLWKIQEVYSNADGSVQFIEFFTTFINQEFSIGIEFKSQADLVDFNSFVFPTNTPAPTANHHLLLATPGFAALPGAVTPDFTLPAAGPFFDPTATTTLQLVTLFGDVFTFGAIDLPTDGTLSLNRNLTTGTNSPKNYAGNEGSVGGTPPLTGDLDSDGFVGITDLNIVLGDWNLSVPPADPLADPSGDMFVGIEDLNLVLGVPSIVQAGDDRQEVVEVLAIDGFDVSHGSMDTAAQ